MKKVDKLTRMKLEMVFDEMAKRYADNPTEFKALLNKKGRPYKNFGKEQAAWFLQVSEEMENTGQFVYCYCEDKEK